MSILKQPIGQKLHTNIAIVRYKKCGTRFEIACYKNKVRDWRSGREKDLDDVLQTTTIFKNVAQGRVASQAEIKAAFGDAEEEEICKVILKVGHLQVSKKERDQELRVKTREIASIVSSKCINKVTRLPFPIQQIEKAMKEIKFNVVMSKNAKQLAIGLIKELEKGELLPLTRQQMILRISLPVAIGKKIKPQLTPLFSKIETEVFTTLYVLVVHIDPGNYRKIDQEVARLTSGKGTVEVLSSQIEERRRQKEDSLFDLNFDTLTF